MKRLRSVLVYALLLSLILAGISLAVKHLLATGGLTREVSITGTITRDGKPLEWQGEKRLLLVTFMPENRESTFDVFPADCDTEAGTFRIAKIPRGRYQVCIQQNDPHPLQDLLNFAFDPAHSTLYCEVTRDGQVVDIDLPKELPRVGPPPRPPLKGPAPGKDQESK